jgi:flagellar biosynthesis/type III secretory pathway protein FliH
MKTSKKHAARNGKVNRKTVGITTKKAVEKKTSNPKTREVSRTPVKTRRSSNSRTLYNEAFNQAYDEGFHKGFDMGKQDGEKYL